MNGIWLDIAHELELKGYRFMQRHLVVQIYYPDGFQSRPVSMGKESEIFSALETAYSHLHQTEALLEAGYSKDVNGFGWTKDGISFQDFRYAWIHFEESKKYTFTTSQEDFSKGPGGSATIID